MEVVRNVLIMDIFKRWGQQDPQMIACRYERKNTGKHDMKTFQQNYCQLSGEVCVCACVLVFMCICSQNIENQELAGIVQN